MLTIRLQRTGTKNKAQFRIVLAEAHKSASKKFLEVLGSYDPRSKNFAVKDETRLKYWLDQNVQVSPSVHNLFVEKKLVEGKKVKAWQPKKKEATDSPTAPAPTAEAPKTEAAAAPAEAPAPEAPAPEAPPAEAPKEAAPQA